MIKNPGKFRLSRVVLILDYPREFFTAENAEFAEVKKYIKFKIFLL